MRVRLSADETVVLRFLEAAAHPMTALEIHRCWLSEHPFKAILPILASLLKKGRVIKVRVGRYSGGGDWYKYKYTSTNSLSTGGLPICRLGAGQPKSLATSCLCIFAAGMVDFTAEDFVAEVGKKANRVVMNELLLTAARNLISMAANPNRSGCLKRVGDGRFALRTTVGEDALLAAGDTLSTGKRR